MHPDTELYLHELRNRTTRERSHHDAVYSFGDSRGGTSYFGAQLDRNHAARIGARLRSLRDWPQPGRPA